MQPTVSPLPVPSSASEQDDSVTCAELQAAYDADPSEPPLWLLEPVRYRSPHARIVPTVLIRRRVG